MASHVKKTSKQCKNNNQLSFIDDNKINADWEP